MERHALDEDGAFAYLTRVSLHTNVKLRAVAQEIVDRRNGRSKTHRRRNALPAVTGTGQSPAVGPAMSPNRRLGPMQQSHRPQPGRFAPCR
jgi:hypothetical protein